MMFQQFPPRTPLELRRNEPSSLFEFDVPVEAEEAFLRVVALWRDNDVLGGTAPTFELRPRRGRITAVTADQDDVHIPSSDGATLGVARCRRLPDDIYLVSISKIAESSRPWQVRVTNNDPEALRFAWFSSHSESATLQPWMNLENAETQGMGSTLSISESVTKKMLVRNWGTAPLVLEDEAGRPLGGEGSPALLVDRPEAIPPHGQDTLAIGCERVSTRTTIHHTFTCNDTVPGHATLVIEAFPTADGGGFVPEPDPAFCRAGCGCMEYAPPPPPNVAGLCQNGYCRHPAAYHFEVPPNFRNR